LVVWSSFTSDAGPSLSESWRDWRAVCLMQEPCTSNAVATKHDGDGWCGGLLWPSHSATHMFPHAPHPFHRTCALSLQTKPAETHCLPPPTHSPTHLRQATSTAGRHLARANTGSRRNVSSRDALHIISRGYLMREGQAHRPPSKMMQTKLEAHSPPLPPPLPPTPRHTRVRAPAYRPSPASQVSGKYGRQSGHNSLGN
jgi:hypothetical protein